MLKKLNRLMWLFSSIRWYAFLRIDIIRYIICRVRRFYYIKIRKNLKTWDGSEASFYKFENGASTIEYNLTGLHDVSCARSMRLIKPLSVIETYRSLSEMPHKGGTLHDLDFVTNAKVLSIGPRTEGEIYCLASMGFKAENIKAIDLISYSPKIDVGDMHNMPYEDDTFDIVIASCVLSYSLTPDEACKEILRVAKKSALMCFSHDVNPKTIEKFPFQKCDDYMKRFQPFVARVFYSHELPENLDEKINVPYTCSVIFQLAKNAKENKLHTAA